MANLKEKWATYLENNEYGNRKSKFIRSRSKPVRAYDETGSVVFEFIGTREAERKTGIDHSRIAACANGKSKTAGGYRWEYVEKEALDENRTAI